MLSQNEDGCELIVMSESVEAMIASFIGHSKASTMQKHDGQYLIYLLEAFVNITFSDNGIEPLLGKDAVYQFTKILSSQFAIDILTDHYMNQINHLLLRVLGNISINHQGKQECIENNVIREASWFLIEERAINYEESLNASLVIMSCSIHLQGKEQIVKELD